MSTVGLQQIIQVCGMRPSRSVTSRVPRLCQDGLGMSSSMTSRSRHEPTERFEKLCLNLDSAYVWSWQATFSALVLPAFCVPCRCRLMSRPRSEAANLFRMIEPQPL